MAKKLHRNVNIGQLLHHISTGLLYLSSFKQRKRKHQRKEKPLPFIFNCYDKQNKRGKAGGLVTELIAPICVQGS